MDAFWQALKVRPYILILIGALAALLTGIALAILLSKGHAADSAVPPPASQSGLIVETKSEIGHNLDPMAHLRCFVGGRFVGESTLAECAKKNGVTTGALDVGVDPAGNLAAAQGTGVDLTPLPPKEVVAADPAVPTTPDAGDKKALKSGTENCWKYTGGEWHKTPSDLSLDACVQTLFNGRCVHGGEAAYGRWAATTLRLVAGRVESSTDNRTFSLLTEQESNCTVSSVP
ncbi:MAG: hypothetical protein CGW95_07365 [Phenylobacterium zucineum]|nr:MAG: hypothetical protein CGW95_07365 [Phenylobacterium zucineum]